MKFRDPKTGEVFDSIEMARGYFCTVPACVNCPLASWNNSAPKGLRRKCKVFCSEYPVEAARLMGYEVIDEAPTDTPTVSGDRPTDKDTNVPVKPENVAEDHWLTPEDVDELRSHGEWLYRTESASVKPRLAEALGLEVGQEFAVKTSYGMSEKFVLGSDGYVRKSKDGITADGSFLCRAINHPENIICAPRLTEPEIAIMKAVGAKWVSKHNKFDDGVVHLWLNKPLFDGDEYTNSYNALIAATRSSLFPRVKPGDCFGLDEKYEP